MICIGGRELLTRLGYNPDKQNMIAGVLVENHLPSNHFACKPIGYNSMLYYYVAKVIAVSVNVNGIVRIYDYKECKNKNVELLCICMRNDNDKIIEQVEMPCIIEYKSGSNGSVNRTYRGLNPVDKEFYDVNKNKYKL